MLQFSSRSLSNNMWEESINPGRTIWSESKKASTKVQDVSSKQDESVLEESWRVKVHPDSKKLKRKVKVTVFSFFACL